MLIFFIKIATHAQTDHISCRVRCKIQKYCPQRNRIGAFVTCSALKKLTIEFVVHYVVEFESLVGHRLSSN